MFLDCKGSEPARFQFLRAAGRGGIRASSNKDSAAILEGLLKGFASFVCLYCLAEGGMFSGHIYFHSCCLMVVQDLVHCWYLAGGSVNWVEYLPRAAIEGLVRRDTQGLMRGSIHRC